MLGFFGNTKMESDESHVRNLILMAKSDNSIDKSELEVIFKIGKERGFSQEEVKDFIKDNKRTGLVRPDTVLEKYEQLFDLVQVMLADGIIEDDEMEFIVNFANKLGFRKITSAFVVTYILEGIESDLSARQIYNRIKKILTLKYD